jgi:hypothetical protein
VQPPESDPAELAALRLILSNVVARLAVIEASDPQERRALLSAMSDTCRLAAERYPLGPAGADRSELARRMLRHIDEFFKGITIT